MLKRYTVLLVLSCCARVIIAQGFVGSCQVFPINNPWNIDIADSTKFPTDSKSDTYINVMNRRKQYLHPDFGNIGDPLIYGIPYEVVGASQPFVNITYDAYGDQSDPGPFPVPPDALVEGGAGSGGDTHVLVVDTSNKKLYELYYSSKNADNSWTANSGCVFDLTVNHYRPDGWTSADAAGLPIFPGLVRYDELAAGEINHAVRFTVDTSQKAWIFPARHHAGKYTDVSYPPMGLRLRLKANYDISSVTGKAKVILTALKKYGMINADNGSTWFISGATDARYTSSDDDDLGQLKKIPGSAFEVVNMGYKLETDNDTLNLPGDSLPVEKTNLVRQDLAMPNGITISQNTPNPFVDHTTINFSLPEDAIATLNIYDALGRRVATLGSGMLTAGAHSVRFAATGLPAGMYVARLQSEGNIFSRMMEVVR